MVACFLETENNYFMCQLVWFGKQILITSVKRARVVGVILVFIITMAMWLPLGRRHLHVGQKWRD